MLILSPAAQIPGITDQQKAGMVALLLALNVPSDLILSQGLPVIMAPSGTVATNGVITLGTALPVVYPQAWVYLPAASVVGGLAGLYYCTFSSTTVGQVFAPGATPAAVTFAAPSATVYFQPSIPTGNMIAAVGSNGAFTQLTAVDVVMLSIPVYANSPGINGLIRADITPINNNSVNNKTAKVKLGAVTINSQVATTDVASNQIVNIRNRSVNSQVVLNRNFSATTVANAIAYTAVNTAVDNAFQVTGQLAVATDYIVLEGTTYELMSNPAANLGL